MTNKLSTISQHFRLNEQPFVRQVDDWIQQSRNEYRSILTRFLNPREQYILNVLVNHTADLAVYFNGGVQGAESQRAILIPKEYPQADLEFEISLLEIKYPTKFNNLHHSTILGSMMYSGISRNVIGDILYDQTHSRWQIIIDSKMQRYIQQMVTKIGHVRVSLIECDLNNVLPHINDWEENFLLLSSLRLDTVISAGFDLSRSGAKKLIEENQVRVNWSEIAKPDVELAIDDVISVRKHGRIQIKLLDGLSKKGKIKSIVNIIRR